MSAKTTAQQGRRTPLSLTGAVSKGQANKGGSNAATNNGNNANGHTTTNNNKQDNKMQQQKTEQQKSNNSDIKENPNNNKKVQQQQQQQQNDNNKKSIEKNQNGVNNSKQQQQHQQQANENKQNKESKQQQNGNNKLNENDKKEKLEKQQHDKSEKLETKSKESKKSEPEIQENNKKDEKKTKEENKADKNETVNKVEEKTQNELQEKSDDKKSKAENDIEVANQQKLEEEKVKGVEVAEELQQQLQQKSLPTTPKSNRASKSSTPANKTPNEKTPQKLTTLSSAIKTTPIKRREVTTTIDDVDMEPLAVESSPIKPRQAEEVVNVHITPAATSTPGKIVLPKRSTAAPKSDVQLAMQSGYSPERPRAFSQISGRKSIRQITEYTPSKFQSNLQFRESYRRINTELDYTNTSMNVTVGSEVPNNLSFSFFGRGRKRDRTPPQLSQSAIGELHTDVEVSPPKKARLEGFFSVVSSPLTLLRNRFSKATLQSSTPVKLEEKLNTAEDEIEVQNVSGVSVHEDLTNTEKATEIVAAFNNDVTLDEDAQGAKANSAIKEDLEDNDVSLKSEKTTAIDQSDIKIVETPLQVAVGDPLAKNKRCIVM